jgi:hypothetical protein
MVTFDQILFADYGQWYHLITQSTLGHNPKTHSLKPLRHNPIENSKFQSYRSEISSN